MTALPGWLVPSRELHLAPPAPVADEDAVAATFITAAFNALRGARVPPWQAFEIIGTYCLEATWGRARSVALGNLAGVKAKHHRTEAYRALTGRTQGWYRAPGHVASGDAPEVIYLAYDSVPQFVRLWLAEFVGPDADTPPSSPLYTRAGALLWARYAEWIDELIAGGYRGERTAAAPAASIAAHHGIVRRVRVLWAQSRLGVRADGRWGSASRAALAAFQGPMPGLLDPGDLDDPAIALLAAAP